MVTTPRHRLTRTSRRHDQTGLALLDVLLGMAIFALIAVIAVQSMAMFRSRAYVTGASSDAQQLATGIESYLTDNSTVPDAITVGPADSDPDTVTTGDLGVNLTNNNSLHRYTVNGPNYTFCVLHMSDTDVDGWVFYNSVGGAIADSDTGAPGPFDADDSPCGP